MRNADVITVLALSIAALGACHKQQPQTRDQNLSMDEGVPDNQVAGNADIETLPPDESSTTPSNQLATGLDNPDVNEVGNSGNSY